MDVVLVSARARHDAPHPRSAAAAELASALAGAGHRVRWVGTAAPASDAGVEVRVVDAPRPAFAAVEDMLYNVPVERQLSAWLRDDPPEVVHVDGFGGACSHLTAWLSARLGVPSLVVAAPFAELVCHRGTLIDGAGAACTRWDDAERCFDCCTTPGPGALSAGAAFWARVTRSFGPLSRVPRLVDFENRLDMVIHGLDVADVVVLATEADRAALDALALPMRGVRVGIPAATDVAGWIALYADAGSLRATR
ncbi:MAG: glycosyltransferase [Planctomycetes bacterium]|nr:glycosyltransferase [Planctomycetota bacterium]